jgi:tRNA pseudouridine55 synthase
MHGWLIIDKPLGLGSTQAVSAVKRALREGGYAKVKVGHGGTLDPLASGVLPIALGEATKLCGRMLDADKVYEFTIGFGVETDTLDGEGVVVAQSGAQPTLTQVQAVLPRFTGPIEQVPPAYSALKVAGKRAYDLARAGEEVRARGRSVTDALSHPVIPAKAGISLPSDSGRKGDSACAGMHLLGGHLRPRLQGHLIRSLARDIARPWHGRPRHHVAATKAGPFRWIPRYRWTN